MILSLESVLTLISPKGVIPYIFKKKQLAVEFYYVDLYTEYCALLLIFMRIWIIAIFYLFFFLLEVKNL